MSCGHRFSSIQLVVRCVLWCAVIHASALAAVLRCTTLCCATLCCLLVLSSCADRCVPTAVLGDEGCNAGMGMLCCCWVLFSGFLAAAVALFLLSVSVLC